MSKNLQLVVKQSDAEIQDYKMMQKINYYACRRCKHKWTATVEHMMYHPECPNCGK